MGILYSLVRFGVRQWFPGILDGILWERALDFSCLSFFLSFFLSFSPKNQSINQSINQNQPNQPRSQKNWLFYFDLRKCFQVDWIGIVGMINDPPSQFRPRNSADSSIRFETGTCLSYCPRPPVSCSTVATIHRESSQFQENVTSHEIIWYNVDFYWRSTAMVSISAGQLLCGGLFSSDSMSHWLSSVALSHALVNNVAAKEMLLRVHLAMTKDAAPISLLQQTFYMLQQVSTPLLSHLLHPFILLPSFFHP